MVIILIGAPGSGKGTNAKYISAKLSIPHLSLGEILRKEVETETNLGVSIRELMSSGRLISDEIVEQIIANRISEADCKGGFILDGYPRNLQQARDLNKIFAKKQITDYIVIELSLDEDTLIKRILGRFTCADCGALYNKYFHLPAKEGTCDVCGGSNWSVRKDDNDQTIRERLSVYNTQTKPLLDFYASLGKITTISGGLSADEIFESLTQAIKSK